MHHGQLGGSKKVNYVKNVLSCGTVGKCIHFAEIWKFINFVEVGEYAIGLCIIGLGLRGYGRPCFPIRSDANGDVDAREV